MMIGPSLEMRQCFPVKSSACLCSPRLIVQGSVGGLRSSADLVTLDNLAGELLGSNAVSVSLALVTDNGTLLLLLLGSNANIVLVTDEALHTVAGLLAGLAWLRQQDLVELAQLMFTSHAITHMAGVLRRSASIIMTADKALRTVAGNMAGLAKLRQSL